MRMLALLGILSQPMVGSRSAELDKRAGEHPRPVAQQRTFDLVQQVAEGRALPHIICNVSKSLLSCCIADLVPNSMPKSEVSVSHVALCTQHPSRRRCKCLPL